MLSAHGASAVATGSKAGQGGPAFASAPRLPATRDELLTFLRRGAPAEPKIEAFRGDHEWLRAFGGRMIRVDFADLRNPFVVENLDFSELPGGATNARPGATIVAFRLEAEGDRLGVLTRSPEGRARTWILDLSSGFSRVECLTAHVEGEPIAFAFDAAKIAVATWSHEAGRGRLAAFSLASSCEVYPEVVVDLPEAPAAILVRRGEIVMFLETGKQVRLEPSEPPHLAEVKDVRDESQARAEKRGPPLPSNTNGN
jgi:hypothetical protein